MRPRAAPRAAPRQERRPSARWNTAAPVRAEQGAGLTPWQPGTDLRGLGSRLMAVSLYNRPTSIQNNRENAKICTGCARAAGRTHAAENKRPVLHATRARLPLDARPCPSRRERPTQQRSTSPPSLACGLCAPALSLHANLASSTHRARTLPSSPPPPLHCRGLARRELDPPRHVSRRRLGDGCCRRGAARQSIIAHGVRGTD